MKSSFEEFLSFLMRFSQSVELWQGRGRIQKIVLCGKRLNPYYDKNSSNKQRETTVHHYFKTWRSVNPENVKNFERFFKCSHKNCPPVQDKGADRGLQEKAGRTGPHSHQRGCSGAGWEVQVPSFPYHQWTIMVQTYQHSREEGRTTPFHSHEAEKIPKRYRNVKSGT